MLAQDEENAEQKDEVAPGNAVYARRHAEAEDNRYDLWSLPIDLSRQACVCWSHLSLFALITA